jgi:hypothetical protein
MPSSACSADGDDVHRTVVEEVLEGVEGAGAVLLREPGRLVVVLAVDGDDFDAGDRGGGAGVGIADVAGAEDADAHGCLF